MTLQRTYDLTGLDAALVHHVCDTLAFTKHEVVEEGGRLTVSAPDAAGLQEADDLVRNLTGRARKLRHEILLEARVPPPPVRDLDAWLAKCPDLCPLGDGLIGLRGGLLRLFRFFEAEFQTLAQAYGAEDQHYPVMLPMEIMEEISYFAHFPQQVTFCSHLPEELPLLQALTEAVRASDGKLPPAFRERTLAPAHALKPAVCLPCYRQYRDQVLPEEPVVAATMQNHVFRYEGRNFRPLSRGWDFSVRDVVFFSTYGRLQALRQQVMERTIGLCEELGLYARIQLANDPFFLNGTLDKSVYQRLGKVKYELVFPLPWRDEELAASSFNLHRDFYTRAYNIRGQGGVPMESACMGFGLERWVYGFVHQHGPEPASWPERVRAAVAL